MEQLESIPPSVASPAIRRIAHPTDFASQSENALSWAIRFVQEYRVELLLLHVVPPPTPLFEVEKARESEAHLALSVLLKDLQTADINTRGFLLTGVG